MAVLCDFIDSKAATDHPRRTSDGQVLDPSSTDGLYMSTELVKNVMKGTKENSDMARSRRLDKQRYHWTK